MPEKRSREEYERTDDICVGAPTSPTPTQCQIRDRTKLRAMVETTGEMIRWGLGYKGSEGKTGGLVS